MNQGIALPRDIWTQFAPCQQVNAYYDPFAVQVVMCYEIVLHFGETFAPFAEDTTQLGAAMINATVFVYFHEMGHALIDQLDLPITGREEDAADQLSTVILAGAGKDGEDMALEGAFWFLLKSAGSQDELAFWDEHSLDPQRFFNIACWIYGKSPGNHTWLVETELLPQSRAQRCPSEWAQIESSWERLLAPHEKS